MSPHVALGPMPFASGASLLPRVGSLPRDPSFGAMHVESVLRFAEIAEAYRHRGGIATGDAISGMLRQCGTDQPLSRLAHWIVAHDVVSLDCHATIWVPLFQFVLVDMSLRPEVLSVTRELADVFDEWDLMAWFVTPNSWLDEGTPVDAMGHGAADVLAAARADRFIARG